MNEIIRLYDLNLIKFLVDNKINVYHGNKQYKVVKDSFGKYISYHIENNFSGGKIELYEKNIKNENFFIQYTEIDKSICKGKIIGLFDTEMYTKENIDSFSNDKALHIVWSDEEFCRFYSDIDSFLLDYQDNLIENNMYVFRLIKI